MIKKINWKKVLFLVSVLTFVLTILGAIGIIILFTWYSKDLPNPENVIRRDGFVTRMYDRNGKLLYDLYKDTKRVTASWQEVPESLKLATISVEDKDFYKHKGFDTMTPIRIVYNLIFRHRLVGGSTLTQQLVKNAILETNERSISRKIREFILAVTIDAKFSKDDILLMYLNEAPYGGPNWGAGTAAESYFGKPLSKLSLTESVILAGMPQRPNVYSPISKTPRAYVSRVGQVLERMQTDGYIGKEKAAEILAEAENYQFYQNKNTMLAPHFVFWVRDNLIKQYGENAINLGLKVTTSLDLEMQTKVQQIVAEEIDKSEKLGISNGAALVLDPRDGQVLAMVGSRGFDSEKTDGQVNVVLRPRQPGSSIKPITYLLALQHGYTPASMLLDTPVSIPVVGQKNYEPNNYSGKFLGPVSLSASLGNSLNIPAVKMLVNVGVEAMLKQAFSMGINSLEPNDVNLKRLGYSVTLGGGEVKMIELAGAYSSFANGGVRVDPSGILKIEDRSGRSIFEFKPILDRKVMTPQEAFLISYTLSENRFREVTFGSQNGLIIPKYQVAVKTGTTNDKKDNWTIGWTPNLLSAVWVGNNDGTAMLKVASGVSGASPIWKRIMTELLPNRQKQDFSVPEGIIQADVDAVSGYPSHDGLATKSYYFLNGSLPGGLDQIHQKLKVCKDKPGLAPPEDVANGNYQDKEYYHLIENDPISKDGQNRWQAGIDTWIAKQPADVQDKYRPPENYCRSGGLVDVNINQPNDRSTVGNNFDINIDTQATKKIVEVKIYINDEEKKTFNDRPFNTSLNLSDGLYKIKVIAKDRDGNTGERTIQIGVNKPWDWAPSSTPTPIPIVTNTPVPVIPIATPSAIPTISMGPT